MTINKKGQQPWKDINHICRCGCEFRLELADYPIAIEAGVNYTLICPCCSQKGSYHWSLTEEDIKKERALVRYIVESVVLVLLLIVWFLS